MGTHIDASWKPYLDQEFDKAYMQDLRKFIKEEKQAFKKIYPPSHKTFEALRLTSLSALKVVIIGQDPYHKEGQAMGLAFSVPIGVAPPPSLKRIFKELTSDLQIPMPTSGDLSPWTKSVLLLNTVLSVSAGLPHSHAKIGWQQFTDQVIKTINMQRKGVIFLLWGNAAKSKQALIDCNRHYILEAAHPSPLARQGFLGCKHFSKTNQILEKNGGQPIDWRLP